MSFTSTKFKWFYFEGIQTTIEKSPETKFHQSPSVPLSPLRHSGKNSDKERNNSAFHSGFESLYVTIRVMQPSGGGTCL